MSEVSESSWILMDRKTYEDGDSIGLVSLWYCATSHKVRITRRRSTHNEQSFARIERWSGARWEELYSYGHDIMAQVIEDHVDRQRNRPNRAELLDEQELLRLADLILL